MRRRNKFLGTALSIPSKHMIRFSSFRSN